MKSLIPTLLFLVLPLAQAQDVMLKMPNGVLANAVYLAGDEDMPTVLLMHGFLQTHHFHTIHQLADGLSDEGFTVLAPTLTLGVPLRKKSLACEAIHTHSIQQAHDEIDAWISWLGEQGKSSVVLVGHSTGSMTLVSYMEARKDPRVAELIGISIVEGRMELDPQRQAALRQELEATLKSGQNPLVKRNFSYCKPLHATTSALLSYVTWTPDRVLQAIDAVEVPELFIMGGHDDRLGEDWIERLKATGRRVQVIDGADHFIDGEFEFELLELVVDGLS